MKVKLLYSTPLWLIANAIRYSHNNHHLSDSCAVNNIASKCSCIECGSNDLEFNGEYICCNKCGRCYSDSSHIGKKDFDLIKRVGFHMNHSSVLEHSLLSFHVELSTKALLEWTRHRVGIAYTVTSSRYALNSMGIEFEKTGDENVDFILKQIEKIIKANYNEILPTKKEFDKWAMLLPQAFMYKMQVSFNLRSLVHFLELRTNKSAHETIRKLAINIIDELKQKQPLYFELLLENKKIKEQYEANYNKRFRT